MAEDGAKPRESREPWHLDRKVPISLLGMIAAQTVATIWWAATTDSRITAITVDVSRVERKIDEQKDDPVRLARLEGFREDLARRLDRFEAKLDRLIEDKAK